MSEPAAREKKMDSSKVVPFPTIILELEVEETESAVQEIETNENVGNVGINAGEITTEETDVIDASFETTSSVTCISSLLRDSRERSPNYYDFNLGRALYVELLLATSLLDTLQLG